MRQLNETYFKYHQDSVQIHERLIFLIIQDTCFHIHKSNNLIPRLENQIRHSQISITDEVNELLNLKKQCQN